MQKKQLSTVLIPLTIGLVMSLGLSACSSGSTLNKHDSNLYIDNARQALSWQGTYQGITPCAGCDGVATMLVLDPPSNYQLRTRLLGKEDKDRKSQGSFRWQPNNTHIEILPENGVPKTYRVTEKFIELTLPDGSIIPSTDPDQYRLYKTN